MITAPARAVLPARCMPRAFLCPLGRTREAVLAIAETTMANIREFFAGGPLVHEICYRCEAGCRKKEGRRCFDLPG